MMDLWSLDKITSVPKIESSWRVEKARLFIVAFANDVLLSIDFKATVVTQNLASNDQPILRIIIFNIRILHVFLVGKATVCTFVEYQRLMPIFSADFS